MQFNDYQTDGFYDEMFDHAGNPRPEARLLLETIESLDDGHLLRSQRAAERCCFRWASPSTSMAIPQARKKSFPSI